MIAVVVFSLLCLAVGFPVAVLLSRREAPLWGSLAVEGALLGLGWYLALGLVVARLGVLGWATLVVPSLAVAAGAWTRAVPVVGRWPRPQPTWFGGAMVLLFAGAAYVRRDAFYFLYQTADFGEYVNRGNILAAGGPFHEWFLQLFSVALALSNLTLGAARTVDVVPFLGLLIVAGVLAVGQRLGFGRVVRGVLLVVLAVEPVAVWYSRFPASETLYAVLLVAFVLFTLLAVRRSGVGEVAVAAGLAGLMMVTRANAVLLWPVLVAALGLGAFLVRRPALRMLAGVVGASSLAMYAGLVYNVRYSSAYFVDYQLANFLPDPLFPYVDGLDHPVEALVGLAVTVMGIAAVVAAALAVNRWVGPAVEGRLAAGLRAAVLPLAAGAMGAALVVAFVSLGLRDAVGRYGWLLLVLVALGAVVVMAGVSRWSDDAARAVAVLSVVIAGAFTLLFAHRLPLAHDAPYFLYWDRYLFSEVFPAMAIVGLWGGAAAVTVWNRWLRGRSAAALGGVALALVLVAGGYQALERTHPQRELVLFGDAYRQLEALDELASPAELPVIYSGMANEDLPEGWLHTNSYRVFALPLQQTFGRDVLNIDDLHPFGPDPRPGAAEVAELVRASGSTRAILIDASRSTAASSVGVAPEPGSSALAAQTAPNLQRRPLGSMTMEIPLLPRRLDPAEETWTELTMDLEVWLVELAPSPVTAPAVAPAGASW